MNEIKDAVRNRSGRAKLGAKRTVKKKVDNIISDTKAEVKSAAKDILTDTITNRAVNKDKSVKRARKAKDNIKASIVNNAIAGAQEIKKDAISEAKGLTSDVVAIARKRGRPKGSKNKPKVVA